MTEKTQRQLDAEAILQKCGGSFSRLGKEGTIKENKTVFKFVADEANRKQRELVGLE
ncbi:hypothetical protein HZY93_07575 [Streptococcus danieliae]|uniref:Uncharacterized protein n=1 Tax=Streptococcus danieliae TaxID=747656 RepID=A0A7Z0LEF7_9STRE|nr:hypothetical protein [Streptococcus danieliae]MBF0700199.1 hypothetical protein [Streptococcus danieliae]MBF0717871.1 hypothetical protein [Streptococcus danieliae]NYS49801.1 hypothetical protein [Streptococcus danieliae]NYS97375.1 hypothetical protein [Streptococcus danieliae]